MPRALKNVAIVGASGNVGAKVYQKLLASENFNVTVLQRAGSKSAYGSASKVVETDFDSVPSITQALKGQDALAVCVGHFALSIQYKLLDACIAAGVQRLLPSEFGSDVDNASTRKSPVQHEKVQFQEHLFNKIKGTDLSYTLVYNGVFLDWGLELNATIDRSKYAPAIYDGGNIPYSTTTLATVGDAVVGVLSHPEETKNRAVRVEDLKVTQNQLLEIAKMVEPNQPWAPKDVRTADLLPNAREALAKGQHDFETVIFPFLLQQWYDPAFGAAFEKTDNELLGIKTMTEERVAEIYESIITSSKA